MRKLVFLLLVIVSSCKMLDPAPEPTAEFTYNLGNNGHVTFNVSSANADSFLWDFGDGESGNGKSLSHTYQKNGNYIVTMTAKGKGGEVVKQQNINVRNITGSAVFFISSDSQSTIRVTIGGKSANITGYYTSGEPDCGGQHTASFSGLTEGMNSFSAEETGKLFPRKWSGNIDIVGNQCAKMRLSW